MNKTKEIMIEVYDTLNELANQLSMGSINGLRGKSLTVICKKSIYPRGVYTEHIEKCIGKNTLVLTVTGLDNIKIKGELVNVYQELPSEKRRKGLSGLFEYINISSKEMHGLIRCLDRGKVLLIIQEKGMRD